MLLSFSVVRISFLSSSLVKAQLGTMNWLKDVFEMLCFRPPVCFRASVLRSIHAVHICFHFLLLADVFVEVLQEQNQKLSPVKNNNSI